MSLFETIVVLGLAAGALAALLRVLPWEWIGLERWKARRPLTCPTCLGYWCAGALGVVVLVRYVLDGLGQSDFVTGIDAAVCLLAMAGIAALVNRWAAPPEPEITWGGIEGVQAEEVPNLDAEFEPPDEPGV